MGILDNKSRIVDAVITSEGRRQLASGKMNIEYYSFTDGDVFYKSSSLGVTDDASSRFYFEAPHVLPHDQIVLESDDSGKLRFENHESIKIFNGTMYQVNDVKTDDNVEISGPSLQFLSGSDFSSQILGTLDSVIDNFNRLQIISTKDKLFGNEDFSLSTNNGTIKLNGYDKKSIDISNVPDLIESVNLSNSLNFKYLPPSFINEENKRVGFGSWPKISSNQTLNYDYILNGKTNISDVNDQTKFLGINVAKSRGFEKSIDFNTSKSSSRLMSQIFEVKHGQVVKLDLLNVGVFSIENVKKKVVFAGKIFNDSVTGATKFINIFTLVFE